MALNSYRVLVKLILDKDVLLDLTVQIVDFFLLIFNSLLVLIVDLKDLLELNLQEGVLLDIGVPDALVTVLVDHRQATVGELLSDTSIDLTFEVGLVGDGLEISTGVGKAALECRLSGWE